MTEKEHTYCQGVLFENVINLALEVIHNSENKEDMIKNLCHVRDAHSERRFNEWLEDMKRNLGVWKVP